MILELFLALMAICLVLVAIGLLVPSESAMAIIGFFLMFLLSLLIITGDLEYTVGATSNITLHATGGNVTTIGQVTNYNITPYNDGTTHNVGYWLALASAIGMIGVIYSIKRSARPE